MSVIKAKQLAWTDVSGGQSGSRVVHSKTHILGKQGEDGDSVGITKDISQKIVMQTRTKLRLMDESSSDDDNDPIGSKLI